MCGGADFAGHGDSTLPANNDFAWTGFADDVLTVIDHIGASSVRAFGHSMGGTATLLAAQKRPGMIEAAWLYEPIVFPPNIVPRNSMMAEAAGKRRREFDSKPEALHRYANRPPLGLMRADALAAYVEHGFHDTEAGTVTPGMCARIRGRHIQTMPGSASRTFEAWTCASRLLTGSR